MPLEDSVSLENNYHINVREINVNSENFHSFTPWEKEKQVFIYFGVFSGEQRTAITASKILSYLQDFWNSAIQLLEQLS